VSRVVVALPAFVAIAGWLWIALRSNLATALTILLATLILSLGASLSALPNGLFFDPVSVILGLLISFAALQAFRQTRSGA